MREDREDVNGLALCGGLGGLELGLSAVWPEHRTVCWVERDPYCVACLVARMEEGSLGPAPVWDDLTTFDGAPWRGIVGCISAGFPCQPWSHAGKQRGTEDARWLWPEIARVVREVGPEWIVLENVPGLVSGGGLGHVLGDLAELGFDAEWGLFGAWQVGAPQVRDRLFIVAHSQGERQPGGREAWDGRGGPANVGGVVADAECIGGTGRRGPGDVRREAGDVEGEELQRKRVRRAADDSRPARYPPGPGADAWGGILAERPDLAPAAPQPSLRGVADGAAGGMEPACRAQRLKALGNGVVPAQVAMAVAELVRIGGWA